MKKKKTQKITKKQTNRKQIFMTQYSAGGPIILPEAWLGEGRCSHLKFIEYRSRQRIFQSERWKVRMIIIAECVSRSLRNLYVFKDICVCQERV